MRMYYSKMSSAVRICYIVAIGILVLSTAASLIVLTSVTQLAAGMMQTVMSVFVRLIVVVAAFVTSLMMSKAVISTEYNLQGNTELSFQIKRIGFVMLYLVGSNFVARMVGGQVISATIGLIFYAARNNHFPIFSFMMKAVFFALIWLVFTVLAKSMGHGDSSDKEFNPHLLVVSIILALSFMMPGTVYDHMYENEDRYGTGQTSDGEIGKINYNAQAVLSRNVNLFADYDSNKINENFNITWVIFSIILSATVQIAIGLFAYKKGRDNYYKRHPRLYEEHFPTKQTKFFNIKGD